MHARWESPEGYQAWLDAPVRAELTEAIGAARRGPDDERRCTTGPSDDRTLRAATDVGGTFTDLVTFSTDPETGRQEILTAKADTTPPDFERGVLDVLAKSGIAIERHRVPGARHDPRDQRDHRAQGRQDRR